MKKVVYALLCIMFVFIFKQNAYADEAYGKAILSTITTTTKDTGTLIDKLKFKQADAITDNNKLYNRIKELIALDAKQSNDSLRFSIFKVQLAYFSKASSKAKNYTYEVIAVSASRLYMFGINEQADQFDFLDTFEKATINDVKLDVSYVDNYVKIWSQAPLNAHEKTILIKWNTKNFSKVIVKEEDPSQKFLNEQKKLIKLGKFKEALKLVSQEGGILYPAAYEDYKNMGIEALKVGERLARKAAKENAASAIIILNSAIDYYFNFYDCKEYKITITDITTFTKQNLTAVSKMVPEASVVKLNEWSNYLDLYGDLVYRNGNSKKSISYFIKSIELNEQDKLAYLCAGDIYYSMKKLDESKKMYKKYVELSTNDVKNIPPRVIQRLK